MGFHPHLQQALHHHVQKESVRCIGGMFLPLIWLAIKWTSLGLRTCLASLAQSSTEECWPGIHPSLRSSSAILLTVSSARLSTVRSRAFSRSAPQLFIFLLSFGIATWRRVQSQRWPLGHWACPGCCPSPCLTEAEPLRLLLHNHGSQCFPCGHTGLYVEAQVGNDWYMQSLHITGLISHEQREDVKHFEKRYKPAYLRTLPTARGGKWAPMSSSIGGMRSSPWLWRLAVEEQGSKDGAPAAVGAISPQAHYPL